jgi:hypothetical protein
VARVDGAFETESLDGGLVVGMLEVKSVGPLEAESLDDGLVVGREVVRSVGTFEVEPFDDGLAEGELVLGFDGVFVVDCVGAREAVGLSEILGVVGGRVGSVDGGTASSRPTGKGTGAIDKDMDKENESSSINLSGSKLEIVIIDTNALDFNHRTGTNRAIFSI